MNKYKNLLEVISIEEFDSLLHNFFSESENFSSIEKIEILEILGEKYAKFYNFNLLDNYVKIKLSEILIELTDFTDLATIQDLGFILFSFRLDNYFLFLKNNVTSIKVEEVKKEVLNSLEEYEESEIKGSR